LRRRDPLFLDEIGEISPQGTLEKSSLCDGAPLRASRRND
jgi:hypothetical protein